MFVRYSEQSKSYRIYIPGYHQIELSKDVNYDEDIDFKKSRKYKEVVEEHETPRAAKVSKSVKNEEEE